MTLTITHTVSHEARQDQWVVHQEGYSGFCHHSSLLLVPFQSPASQGWCLISSLTPTEGHALQMGEIMGAHHKCWFWVHFQICWDPLSRGQWLCIPVHSVPFQNQAAQWSQTHTHRHHNLKPTMHCAANTQLSNLKAFLILMEEPPCHILSPEHPAGCRMMNLLTDSLLMCWLITWPWPNWIWAVQVARPGLKPRAFSTSSFWPSSPRSLSEWAKEAQYIHPSGPRSKTFSSKQPSQSLPASPHLSRSWFNRHFIQGGLPSRSYSSITLYNCFPGFTTVWIHADYVCVSVSFPSSPQEPWTLPGQ